MSKEIKIGDKFIGGKHPVFIIAEAGLNHGGNLDIAIKMVEEAAKAGADAIKFQAFDSSERFGADLDSVSFVKDSEFKKTDFEILMKVAKENDILMFATPFDVDNLHMLQEIGVELIKIASCDITNKPLLSASAGCGLPSIMSRGSSGVSEIDAAISIYTTAHAQLALMHCVSSYPMDEEDANLSAISVMKSRYDIPIGYSDHSVGIEVPLIAVAHGAKIIEKHFTLDRSLKGIDWQISAEPMELTKLVSDIARYEVILGDGLLQPKDCELDEVRYRKSTRLKQ